MVTAGSPPELVARLDAELRKILAMPDIAGKIADLGGTVKADGPAAFKSWFADNVRTLGEVVRENGIKGE